MARRDYPAYIIDRSRRSEASRFSDDFVVCTDRECGFIARAYKLPRTRREEMLAALVASSATFVRKTIGDATIVLEIVRYMNEPVAHASRVPSLLKKALKAYLYGEVAAVPGGGGYDEQIAALDDVVRMAEAQHPHLVDMNGRDGTERFIAALRAARESVALLKTMSEHGRA